MLDLYSDYLITSFGQTSCTKMSKMFNNNISHDKATRFLSNRNKKYNSKDLWSLIKPTIRNNETDDGVIIFDDTIINKPHTDMNDIVNYHFDHSKNISVKGINILNCFYHNDNTSSPISFEIVKKEIRFSDIKTKKEKRKASVTKNQLMQNMISLTIKNKIKFKYVLADSWFSSKDNMEYITQHHKKDFIFAIKTNRLVALSLEDKLQGKFKNISNLDLKDNQIQQVYIKGYDFPVIMTKQVFTNKDGSTGTLYLVSSDLNLSYEKITTIYQKRWKVEEYHKSLKQNASAEKSPTRTVVTQNNHFFASVYAFFKLQALSVKIKINHFALKAKLYINAIKSAHEELQRIRCA